MARPGEFATIVLSTAEFHLPQVPEATDGYDRRDRENIVVEDTGAKYLAGYRIALEKAEQGALPPLGIHILLGDAALEKTRNTARNIEEGRTHPIQVVCRKPSVVA